MDSLAVDVELVGDLLKGEARLVVADDDVHLLGGQLGAAAYADWPLLWLAV